MVQPVKKTNVIGSKPDNENDLPDDEDLDLQPWEEDLAQWADDEAQENETTRFILYRRTPSNKGKEKVWEWFDEVPSSHDIGVRFGGGSYSAYMVLPTLKKGKPR